MHPLQQLEVKPGISAIVFASGGQAELDAAVLDLAAVLDGLVFDNFEIVVVHSSSRSGSSEKLAELSMRFPQLPLRPLTGDFADDAAALAAAFGTAGYDLIFVTSADGQYDMRELNHLLDAIEQGADLAIGYRPRRADGLGRRLDGWAWNRLINVVFGSTARDVDCAFKLFRKGVWRRVGMGSRTPDTFYAELLVRARRLGFQVTEVPVSHHASTGLELATPVTIWRALCHLNGLRTRMKEPQPPGDPSAASPVSMRGRAA